MLGRATVLVMCLFMLFGACTGAIQSPSEPLVEKTVSDAAVESTPESSFEGVSESTMTPEGEPAVQPEETVPEKSVIVEKIVEKGPKDVSKEVCGDGVCGTGENATTCPKDCLCGNGKCDTSEDITSCPQDCTCGNGKCDVGETQASCPKDCVPTIWVPKPGTTWQWQLNGTIDTSVNVDVYDIDLFDVPVKTIQSLKAKGRKVICYFSAGSYEKWRTDADMIPQAARGQKMDGWDELWLDVRHKGVLDVMKKRLDLAKSKGCDGVEPDNVDGYQNKTGFPLTAADQLAYNKALAAAAHQRGLSIGLKNDLDQVKQLVGAFDFAVNEQCFEYNECKMISPFIQTGKAVFHVEYPPYSKLKVCNGLKGMQFSTLFKKLDLKDWYEVCP